MGQSQSIVPSMFWYRVALKIQEILTNLAPTVLIGAYSPDELNIDENGAIFIIKGGQPNIALYHWETGKCTFYIECWIRSEEQDVERSYRRLAILEEGIIEAIYKWIESDDDIFREGEQLNGIDNITLLSDGDINRPYLGDSIAITFNYLKVRE